jgi:hypothetical protein
MVLAKTEPKVKSGDGANSLVTVAATLVVLGLVWTWYNSSHGNFRNPGVQWAVVILVSIGFLAASWYIGRWAEGEDGIKVAVRYIPIVAAFFILVGVVGGIAKTNRDTGIPTESLIDTNGNIKNPDAYIRFHKKVEAGANKIYFDEETEEHIYKYNKLPDWVVVGGYTNNPVEWVKAHPDASTELKDRVLKTRKVN